MRLSRTMLFVLAAAVVLFAGAGFAIGYLTHRPDAPAAAPTNGSTGPAVSTSAARRGRIDIVLNASGRIGPPAGSDAKLSFPLAGIVATVDVKVGEAVVEGQILASLDTGNLADTAAAAAADANSAAASYSGGGVTTAAAQSAAAKLAVAQTRLRGLERRGPGALSDRIAAVSVARQAALKVTADRRTLARQQTLFVGGVVASKDVEAARQVLAADEADARSADAKVAAAGALFDATIRQSRADVDQARSDLRVAQAQGGVLAAQAAGAEARADAARRDVVRSTLRAPQSGVVLAILKHAGEAVDPTTPALVVGPPSGHSVTLAVSSLDARRMQPGNPVTMLSQDTGRSVSGRIEAVVPSVDPTTQTSTVVIDGAPLGARSGDAISARVTIGRASGVLVPSAAVVEDPGTGHTVVFVATGKKTSPFESREVTVTASDSRTAVIGSGVRAGERVASQGAYNLLAPNG